MDKNGDGVVDRSEFRAAVDRGELEDLLTGGKSARAPPLRSLVDRLDRVIAEHDLARD